MLIYFLQDFYDEIADQIFKLGNSEKNVQSILLPETHRLPASTSCRTFIKQPPARLEAFGEALVKRWLERIIVWEDHFTVELKSGLNMDIEG